MRTTIYTAMALTSFAANSLLCRMALGQRLIDAATFSTIRIIAGAVTLAAVLVTTSARARTSAGSWMSAALLFLYAIPFSIAYVSLTTGSGALLLFGSVQLTMILVALRSGTRPHPLQWTGLVLGAVGLVYLLLPGLSAPALSGAVVMIVSGIAWALYSVLGRGSIDPLADTTGNFVRAVPMALAVSLVALPWMHLQMRGVLLAAISGAITSGLGYVVWYAALRRLSAFRAAVVQLPTPILAATGGVAFLGESVSTRLVVAAVLVVGGIALALIGRERMAH